MATRDDYRKEFKRLGVRQVRELIALGKFNENTLPQARAWVAEIERRNKLWAWIAGLVITAVAAIATVVIALK